VAEYKVQDAQLEVAAQDYIISNKAAELRAKMQRGMPNQQGGRFSDETETWDSQG